MVEVIHIAKCSIHGIHGSRDRCFVCNGQAEQIRMVSADDYEALLAAVEQARRHLEVGDPAGGLGVLEGVLQSRTLLFGAGAGQG